MTTSALRPYLPADTPLLADIFRTSIEELTGEDYSHQQQEAWMAQADDEAVFAKNLAAALTLVLTVDGAPMAFAAMKDNAKVDMLYVQPQKAGQGFGSHLMDALERLAAARGAKTLSADATDNALDFFAKRGYEMKQRNSVSLNGEWLASTTMEKPLAAASEKTH
ncbi:MAG: GNAT family N-acetyltransferase [Beijerinckiaceae bacterium]